MMGFQFMVVLLLGLAIPTTVNCNLEGDVLHAQRTAWKDPNNVLQSWDPTLVNPCTWFHITCNNNNSVIRVDLGNAGLSGPLIPQLGELANLQYFELFRNNLTGTIPNALGNLKNLVSLDLQNNMLSGVIPPSLANMVALRYLRLNGNALTGEVPTKVLDLVLTGNLIEMNVSTNFFTGTVRTPHLKVATIIQDSKASN